MFSIIIPLFNKEHSIERAVISAAIALQNVKKAFKVQGEIIVVNDGSTDRSLEKVRRLQTLYKCLRVLNQDNAGASAARNAGIVMAKEKYIALLDADDCWHPDHLLRMANLISLFPEAGIYAAGMIWIRDGVDVTPAGAFLPEEPGIIQSYFRSITYGRMPVTSSSCVIPSHVFEVCGLFPEDMSHGEDRALWAHIAAHFEVAYDPEQTAYSYIDPTSGCWSTWTPFCAEEYINHLEALSRMKWSSLDLRMHILSEHYRIAKNAISAGYEGVARAKAQLLTDAGLPDLADEILSCFGQKGQPPVFLFHHPEKRPLRVDS